MNGTIFMFLFIPAAVTACMNVGYLCGLTDAKRAAEKRAPIKDDREATSSLTVAITAQTEVMERLAHSNYTLAKAILAEQDDQGESTGVLNLAGESSMTDSMKAPPKPPCTRRQCSICGYTAPSDSYRHRCWAGIGIVAILVSMPVSIVVCFVALLWVI